MAAGVGFFVLSFVCVSYRPDGLPPYSCRPVFSRGRRRRRCTTPAHTRIRRMRRREARERSRDLLRGNEERLKRQRKKNTKQDKNQEIKSVFGRPGLHLRVRTVLILVFLWTQKFPSVYTSLMSFPIFVFCGDERKLPRLMAP